MDGALLVQELRHQVDRDHRLARPRAAADDDDALPAIVVSLPDAVEHALEHDELLVEQHVLRLLLDDLRHVVHQLLAGPEAVLLDPRQDVEPAASVQVRAEELAQAPDVVRREQPVARERVLERLREQDVVGQEVVVVQVGAGAEPDRRIVGVERLVVVEQVLPVLARLHRRVEDVAVPAADPRDDLVADHRGAVHGRPLLELHDHGVRVGRPVVPRDDAVEPPRGEGQLVLEDHPVVVELRLLEHHRRRPQRVLPRLHLVRRRVVAVVVEERGAQALGDLVVGGVLDEVGGPAGVEAHQGAFRLLPRAPFGRIARSAMTVS